MRKLFSRLGPGLLYAGAAIGVSHVVQSTKAGAIYGLVMIAGIFLAHIFKYPFFELGPRYASSTGESLVGAYRKLGKGAVVIVLILTVSTMFTVEAAVTVVTAGIALKLFGLQMAPWAMSGIILLICAAILNIGHFDALSNLMKVIMVVLAITTIIAALSSFFVDRSIDQEAMKFFSWSSADDNKFLIAFIGWMPAPLDIAIWHSLWTVAGMRSRKEGPNFKRSMFDFKVGYWGTAFLALCFLLLGANVIYGSGTELSSSGVVYAGQLIDLYTSSIGSWSYYIIAIAALTTMFSTTLTCLDAMPRVLTEISVGRIDESDEGKVSYKRNIHRVFMGVIILGAVVLLSFFVSNMAQMVTIATSISFLTAPVLAYLGMRVAAKHLPVNKWSKGMWVIAWAGLVFLVLMSVYYLYNLWITS